MSQENVETVQAGFDAWNAGDMDRLRALYDPNVVLHVVPDWPEPGPYVGREAAMGFYDRLRDSWDFDAIEPNMDFVEVADHVLVRHTWRAHGHGPDLNFVTTILYTLRNGRVILQEYFWDHADALTAVGLEE